MSYFAKGHHAGDKVDDFDDHDPTPYGGGYDISVTYGHSIPPSDATCYCATSTSGSLDYDRPQFSSYAQSSAYGNEEALRNEYKSYNKPKSRPALGAGREPGPDHRLGQRMTGGEYDGGSEVHDRPQYGRSEDDDYKKPSYERGHNDDDDDDKKKKKKKKNYDKHHDDDDDDKKKHGHKKYGGNDYGDDDDDDDKKKKRHNKHKHDDD